MANSKKISTKYKYRYPTRKRSKLKPYQTLPFSKIIITIIILSIIAVFLALTLALIFKPENQVKLKISGLVSDYYENFLYQESVNPDNSPSIDQPNKDLLKYEEYGFTPVLLRQIIFQNHKELTDDDYFILDYCDENNTSVKYFPESPYTKTSYHTEITYSCNF